MIGVSLGDLIKLLDQVPGWKALSGLPKRVKDLEDQVAALEAKPAAPAAEACPLCGEPMKVTKVGPHPTFGRMGVQQRTLECTACPHKEDRMHDPMGRVPKAR